MPNFHREALLSRTLQLSIQTLILVCVCGWSAAWSGDSQLTSECLDIVFTAGGGSEQIVARPGNVHLSLRSDLPAFAVISRDAHGAENRIPLTNLRLAPGHLLTAASTDGTKQVVLAVSGGSRHLALRLVSTAGLEVAYGHDSLVLGFYNIAGPRHLSPVELDYMVDLRGGGDWFECHWDHLDHAVSPGNLGAIALYTAADEADEDKALFHIWSESGIAHPQVTGPWTVERARAWMTDWWRLFADRSQMILEGKDIAELRAAIPYALKMQAKEIYLFTQTWRTDNFWPGAHGHIDINRAVFPAGETDLRLFSDELASNGICLKLHYVSGGIGKDDHTYIGKKPDRRLATWVTGSLAAAIGAGDREILFRPSPQQRKERGLRRNMGLPDFMEYHDLRLGDELVQVGSFENLGYEVWTLRDCQRGAHGTDATTHAAASEGVGLISPYNQVFVPDNDSTLLDEIALSYAGLLERCRIANAEYDGAEIHCADGAWGYRKFATLVYQHLSHPVTSHDSSASAPRCHFEYRFSASKRIMRGACQSTHGGWNAPVILDTPAREASRMLDAHYLLSQGHFGGAQGVSKPEPMFSVSAPIFTSFGLSDSMLKAILDWKEASRLMTVAQHDVLQAWFTQSQSHMPEHSFHPVSAVVPVVKKMPTGYTITPTRVLVRATGDIPWQQGQEHGPISPRQYLVLGGTLALINPDHAQVPHFTIRVLWAFAHDDSSEQGKPGVQPARTAGPAGQTFTTGNDAASTAEGGNEHNQSLMPGDGQLHGDGPTAVVAGKTDLQLTLDAESPQDFWECRRFKEWGSAVDMSHRRGIGMEVTGDGNGEVLLIQISGRDYAVPIDFTGKRWIEIPNGEVAWSQACWGWRMDTKHCDYAHIGAVKLGFGFVPARVKAAVTVSALQALHEIPVTLQDPVIAFARQKLALKGTVGSGEYLDYQGGETVGVYDPNWKLVRTLAIVGPTPQMAEGPVQISIDAKSSGAKPWLEVQVMSEGVPLRILNH